VPFTVTEYLTSRRVVLAKDTESATLEFVGYGSSDDAVARANFAASIPAFFTAFTNPLALLDWESYTLGGLFWRAEAHYGPDAAPLFPAVGMAGPPTPVAAAPGPNAPIGADYSFDFTGVTEHVTQSKATTSSTRRGGGVAPDYKGAIGVTADGRVEGCDRLAPNLEWTRTVTFGSVTLQYIQTVADMVGSTNDATFYGRPAKSVIFAGGNCQIDDTYRAKVTFKFQDRKNQTSVLITSGLSVAAKAGSEYLWVSYQDNKDGVANAITQVPFAAYTEQVVDAVDFGQLRIGV
jgi:hypothetical protein